MSTSSRQVGTVERAFELAPDAATLKELRDKLKSEGCTQVDEHLSGGSIRSELKKLLRRLPSEGQDSEA